MQRHLARGFGVLGFYEVSGFWGFSVACPGGLGFSVSRVWGCSFAVQQHSRAASKARWNRLPSRTKQVKVEGEGDLLTEALSPANLPQSSQQVLSDSSQTVALATCLAGLSAVRASESEIKSRSALRRPPFWLSSFLSWLPGMAVAVPRLSLLDMIVEMNV